MLFRSEGLNHMIIWYLLELGLTLRRHASCELLAFDVDHVYTPLMGSSIGFIMIQETILVSIPIRVQSQAFGLEIIHSIQGSNNYDGLKR